MDTLSLMILRLLQDNPYLMSHKDIQRITGQSDKKVRQALTDISNFTNKNNGELRVESGKYYLYPTETNFVKAIETLDFYDYRLSRMERLMLEFFLCSLSSECITIQHLSDILCVSRSTMNSDLKELADILAQHDIHLLGHTGIGLHLSGEAEAITQLVQHYIGMNRYIFEILLQIDTVAACFEGIQDVASQVRQAIKQAEVSAHHFLIERSEQGLALFLTWWLYRHRPLVPRTPEPSATPSFREALFRQLDLSEGERAALTAVDLKCFGQTINASEVNASMTDDIAVQVIVMAFIERISKALAIPLVDDFDFYQNLTRHIQSVLANDFQMMEMGATLQFINREYPEIHEAVGDELAIFESLFRRPLSEEEQGLILVYVCTSMEKFYRRCQQQAVLIVCNAGVGIGRLLQSRLEARFQFSVVGWVGKNQLAQIEPGSYDFIISTVPLEVSTPYVLISSLLTLNDISRINQMMSEVYLQHPHTSSPQTLVQGLSAGANEVGLLDLLPSHRIQLDLSVDQWQEAIRVAAQPLLDDGSIKPTYITAMMENIEQHGPYMMLGRQALLPHAELGQGSLRLGFSFARLAQPLKIATDVEPMIRFIFVLSPVDGQSHLTALFQLNRLLKHPSLVAELATAQDAQAVLSLLSQALDQPS